MNYTLNQLQIFQKIAALQSVTKAAEELHLTQPAVSIQLKQFQDQFEFPLTEVVGRRLYVTDFGKEIAAAVDKILAELETINLKTLAFKGKLIGKLKISVVSTGKYVMPFFLAPFLQQHDGVELQMDVTNKARVVESLEKNEVDFALVSLLPDHFPLEAIPLMQNKLYLVGAKGLYQKMAKSASKIIEEVPFIYREKGSATRTQMEKFIIQSKLNVHKKIELTTNEAVKQAVIAGLGISIMPLIGIKNELFNQQLEIIPMKKFPLKTNWHLVWLKGKKFSPAANAYLNFLRAEKSQLVKHNFTWFEEFK